MAYIGSPPQNRILSSDDIAQGAVTLNDINFTDQPTNMDITGVIDKHTMRLADGVTITGDVTISDDLVLSKISDDGNAITMTNDGSSRTITGSGSIEASTLSQTPNASLTGMTGTVGSAVTNNAGVASGVIGSAVTGGSGLTGSTCFQQFRLTSDEQITSSIEVVGANIALAEVSGGKSSFISQSSGIFSFTTTGIYWIMLNADSSYDNDAEWQKLFIYSSTNSGTDYTEIAQAKYARVFETGSEGFAQGSLNTLLAVTNASTQRIKFQAQASANSNFSGSSTVNRTYMTFLRIGS